MSSAPFDRPDSSLRSFLVAEGTGDAQDRFVARNFRLDEHVELARADRYEAALDGVETHEWNERHEDYLETVAAWRLGVLPPRQVDIASTSTPETFRQPATRYASILDDTWLVRVMTSHGLARAAGVMVAEVEAALTQPRALRTILSLASQQRGQLPSFAAFWEDLSDLLPEDSAEAPSAWAEELRDRLGLAHLSPRTAAPIDVLVFRYPASRVPRTKTKVLRPLTIPSVLDMRRFSAFCPAPAGAETGRVVDLGGRPHRPRRELLHPPVRLKEEDLFRRGTISRAVPPLETARREHLLRLRSEFRRLDYARQTDSDLIL